MKVIASKPRMAAWSAVARNRGETIAFVPTMGYLHQGHLSLVQRAKKLADRVVVSIYVNPTQFGPKEDYKNYPRNINRDLRLLKRAGVDVAFTPQDMYGSKPVAWVDPGPMQNLLCGRKRPGHFRGVATVVFKLLEVVKPNVAVFGQKDAQQFLILRRMVMDLDLGVRMVASPIIREKDGLAMSSRNARLSGCERILAPSLYRGLVFVRNAFRQGRRRAPAVLKAASKIPLGKVEYFTAVNPLTLEPVKLLVRGTLVAVAMRLGSVRLIDNIIL
jgi:pantoate--beta-alanine ligase